MESLSQVALEHSGRRHDLQLDQVTVDKMRRLFQLGSETWLRDDSAGILYFPQHDGSFNLRITTYPTLVVEGPAH